MTSTASREPDGGGRAGDQPTEATDRQQAASRAEQLVTDVAGHAHAHDQDDHEQDLERVQDPVGTEGAARKDREDDQGDQHQPDDGPEVLLPDGVGEPMQGSLPLEQEHDRATDEDHEQTAEKAEDRDEGERPDPRDLSLGRNCAGNP